MKAVFRWIVLTTVRIFFREIGVRDLDKLPEGRPLLIVANHPNALIDPAVVWVALEREVGFLGKSTLFDNPVGKFMMESFAGIPVFRAKDGKDTSLNDRTYEICAERFAQGRSIVMFPEGVSHNDPQMRKLKTGAARFALKYVMTHEGPLEIVPVGLFFEAKAVFRSRVSVAVGEPIQVRDWLEKAQEAEFEAALDLTEKITKSLHDLVLQADNTEMWETFAAVARWTNPVATKNVSVAQRDAQRLADAYQRLRLESPEEAESIAEDVLKFAEDLRGIGIQNPWDMEDVSPSAGRLVGIVLRTFLILPFALVGTAASYVPYRALGPLARKISGNETDMISTVKAIGGMVFMPWVYLLEAVAIGFIWGWELGLLAFALLPFCGLAALRFWEKFESRKVALKSSWFRFTKRDVASQIRERRAELSERINSKIQRLEEARSQAPPSLQG